MYRDFRGHLPKPKLVDPKNKEENELMYDVAYQPSDPFYKEDFVKGENGFIQNDIQIVLRNQNESTINQLLAKIEQRAPDFADSAKSVDDIINEVVPRSCQSFSETERFVSRVSKIFDSVVSPPAAKETIDFSETEPPKEE